MSRQPSLEIYDDDLWIQTKDGNSTARAIFHTHYSYRPYADRRDPALFVGPGEKLVLLSPNSDALFVWRKFISGDRQQGVNCSVFHNDGPILSSTLILEAERIAWQRWPSERLYTYVNPKKLKIGLRRGNPYCHWPPGRCFIEAGWRYCGTTKHNRLLVLEKLRQ